MSLTAKDRRDIADYARRHPNQRWEGPGSRAEIEDFNARQIRIEKKGLLVNLSKLRTRYDRNENQNAHSENALLLARHFGTAAEIAKATALLAERDRIGCAPDDAAEFQAEMSRKYYQLITATIRS